MKYSKEQQLGKNYREVMDRNKQGRKVRYVVGDCEKCGEYYKKKHHGCRHKELCAGCAMKRGWEKHKGQTHDHIRTGKDKECKVCKKKFYVKKCQLTTKKFCSWGCYDKWMKENPRTNLMVGLDTSGKNNAQYKHGRYAGKRSHYRGNRRKVKEELVERDGGKECLLCGKPGDGLHMHRVIYGSQGGKYETDNCVQLCGEDHALVHSSKKTWLEPLLQYLKEPNIRNRNNLIKLRLEALGEDSIEDWYMEQ